MSGLIDWKLVALFVIGGFAGSILGTRAAVALAQSKHTLSKVFAGIVGTTGAYVVLRGMMA